MPVTVQAFRGATVLTPTRVTTRPNFAKVAMRTSRPANLQSEFLSPVAALKGLCMSFSQLVLEPARQAFRSIGMPLIEANKKKGKGCTLEGTRRKRARVSGFRTRMETPGGRKVLASRRAKGRKVLCPAAKPSRKTQKSPKRPRMGI